MIITQKLLMTYQKIKPIYGLKYNIRKCLRRIISNMIQYICYFTRLFDVEFLECYSHFKNFNLEYIQNEEPKLHIMDV